MGKLKLFSTADVARELQLSVPTITHWARELGVGQLVGNAYVFTEEEVERIRNRPGARHRYRPRTKNAPQPKPEGE